MTMKKPAPPSQDPAERDTADAREFADYARTQDPADLEAALWVTRRADGQGQDGDAEAGFRAWLSTHPHHRQMYESLEQSLDGVHDLPQESVLSLKAGLRRDNAGKARSAARPASPQRRAWLRMVPQAALATVALAVVGGGWMGWDHGRGEPTFSKDYATARGQRLDIDLPDGSRLQLDAATAAQVRLYRGRREVALIDGQAMFIVAHDADRPFDVLAGATRVRVVGTRFSVRHAQSGMDAGKTVVAVESGQVRVSSAGVPADPGATLGAGQGVTADGAGVLQAVVSLSPQGVAAWREGRVSFDDTPLAQALAEFERYGDTGLVVRDAAVGALRIGGSFDLRQIDAFAQALPQLLPVRLVRRDGRTEVVGAR